MDPLEAVDAELARRRAESQGLRLETATPPTGPPASVEIRRGEQAGFGTLRNVGIPDDPQTKIQIFAAARFPNEAPAKRESRYGLRDGRIYYLDEQNQYRFETDGFWQRLKGFLGDVAANAPAELGALLLSRWGWKGAALGGAGGEWMRNFEARERFDEPQSVFGQFAKPATVGAFSGAGEKGGGEIPRLIERGMTRLRGAQTGTRTGARAARRLVREAGDYRPIDPAAEQRLRRLFEKHGIPDPTMVETTGSRKLADRFSLLGDLPATSDAVQDMKLGRMEDVQRVVDQFLEEISPSSGPYETGGRLKRAGEGAFESIRSRQKAASEPLYEEAFQTSGPVQTRPALQSLDRALEWLSAKTKTAKAVRHVKELLQREQMEIPPPAGLRPSGPSPGYRAPVFHEAGEFMDEAAERAALTEQFQPKPTTVEAASAQRVGGASLTVEDRSVLGGLQASGILEPADALIAEKAIRGGNITPYEGMRLKQLLTAGQEAMMGPGTVTPEATNVIPMPQAEAPSPTIGRPQGNLAAVAQPIRQIPLSPDQLAKAKPVTVPEERLKTLQSARFELDAILEGTDPDVAKLPGSQRSEIRRELTQAREELTAAMRNASREFGEADDVWAGFLPELERLEDSAVGNVARLKGEQVTAATRRLLEGAFVEPQTVAYARDQILAQDPAAWDGVVKEYFRSFWSPLKNLELASDQTVNLGGRLAGKLSRHREIMKVAMAHNPTLRRNYDELMEVLKATGLLFRKESQTEPRRIASQEMGQEARRGPLGVVTGLMKIEYTAPLKGLGNWIERVMMTPKYQAKLLEALQEPQASLALQHMKRLPPRSVFLIRNLGMLLATFTGAEIPEALERAREPDRKPQVQP